MEGVLRADGAVHLGESYALVNNTWGRRDLANGHDYVQTISYGEGIEGAAFEWAWPAVAPRRVLAYPELIVGESPWSGHGGGEALPLPLAEIDSLTASYDLAWGGEIDRFNVAFDLWLSADPNAGRAAVTHEIMIWVKSAGFSPGGAAAGRVELPGLAAEFRYKPEIPGGWPEWDYAAFRAETDMAKGRLDLAAVLDHLVAEGLAEPDLWLMSVELGAEVTGGAGWLRIEAFDLAVNAPPAGTAAVAAPPPAPEPPPDGFWNLLDFFF